MGKGRKREEKRGDGGRLPTQGGKAAVVASMFCFSWPFPSGWIILAPATNIFSIPAPPLQLVPFFSCLDSVQLLNTGAASVKRAEGAESFSHSRQLRHLLLRGAMWGQPGEGGGCAGGERSERQAGLMFLQRGRLTCPGPPQPISLLKVTGVSGEEHARAQLEDQRKCRPPWGFI